MNFLSQMAAFTALKTSIPPEHCLLFAANVSLDKAEFAEQVTSRAASALGALQPQEEVRTIATVSFKQK